MASGGKRQPKGPRPPSGVGKFSRRTDGQVQAQAPVQDADAIMRGKGQQWGQGKEMRAAMASQPLKATPEPEQRSAPSEAGSGAGQGAPPGGLPPWFFQMATDRPGEPLTAGGPFGDGPGPEVLQAIQQPEDDAEEVLAFLEREFHDQYASDMRQELRMARQTEVAPTFGGPPSTPGTPPLTPGEVEPQTLPLPAGEDPAVAPSAALPPGEGGGGQEVEVPPEAL